MSLAHSNYDNFSRQVPEAQASYRESSDPVAPASDASCVDLSSVSSDQDALSRPDHQPTPPHGLPPAPEPPPERFADPTIRLKDVRRIVLDSVSIDVLTQEQTLGVILNELDAGVGGTVVTPNLDHLCRAHGGLAFRDLNERFELSVADGMPVVWASKVRGTPLPERVAGSDLFETLPMAAARRGRSVFLFGGNAGTAEKSADILKARTPDLKIAGTYYPPFGFEQKDEGLAAAAEALRAAQPDIVFVALGSPKQEKVIQKLRATLPNAWWLGVGISFSFLVGEVQRAPKWLRMAGGEFLHRLIQEPGKLGKRYAADALYLARLLTVAGRYRIGLDRSSAIVTTSVAPGNDEPAPATPALVEAPAAPTPPPPLAFVPSVADSGDQHEAVNEVLSRVREMILLGGSTMQSRMAMTLGRPTLELPLRRRGDDEPHAGKMERLLDAWIRWGQGVADMAGLDYLPIRLVVNDKQSTPELVAPEGVVPRPPGSFEIDEDLSEYRGTGGLLHDLTKDHDERDLVLVCTARQIMLDPLPVVVRTLAGRFARGADASLFSHHDGTPVGVMLLRCGLLHNVKANGFVDMKQQVLPGAINKFDVRVVPSRRPTNMPVFGVASYIAALTQYHATRRRGLTSPALEIPGAEDFSCHFALAEDGATVADSAYLHDAVVLDGATVEAGAAVIGSVIGPGVTVRKGQQVFKSPLRKTA